MLACYRNVNMLRLCKEVCVNCRLLYLQCQFLQLTISLARYHLNSRTYSSLQKATHLKESHGDIRFGKDQKYHRQERTKASVPYRWPYITKSYPGSF